MIVPSLANKGPIIVTQDLCKGLMAKGHFCKVFYFDDIVELKMPCEVERIKFSQKIDFSQWDIVHSHMLRPDLWVFIHKPWSKRNRPKFISTLHNPISYRALRILYGVGSSFLGTLLWNLALLRVDKIVVLNADTGNSQFHWLKKKVIVIFNGRNVEITQLLSNTSHRIEIDRIKKKYTVLGTVCGVLRRKGLEQIIKALPLLSTFAFVVVGDGPQVAELKQLAEQLGVADRCYWFGYTKNATEYYSVFDMFVLPSRSEGFPLALIEAAAYKLPVILSDIPIFKAITSFNQVGFFKLDNINDLVKTINSTYINKTYYSEQIYLYYKNSLTLDKMVERYEELYIS